jgi:hypothetical protein
MAFIVLGIWLDIAREDKMKELRSCGALKRDWTGRSDWQMDLARSSMRVMQQSKESRSALSCDVLNLAGDIRRLPLSYCIYAYAALSMQRSGIYPLCDFDPFLYNLLHGSNYSRFCEQASHDVNDIPKWS